MKIVLFTLNSSYIHKSLSVRCLEPRLAARGFETVVLEYTVKEKRLTVLDALYAAEADLYCFSCYIWNISEMKQAAAKLKKLRPEAVILFGGPEVSYEGADFFAECDYVDFLVAGEGEESLPSLCEAIRDRGAEEVKREGRIYRSEPYEGFADAGILYRESDVLDSSVVYYESCRGCPYSCSYCLSASEKGIRAKDAEKVLSELLAFEKLSGGIRVIKFVDRTFNFDRRRAVEIWRGLLSDVYTKTYHFEICAELLDEEAFEVLSRFPKGKIQLEAGVQSTNPDTLATIHRKSNPEVCIANLKRIRKMGNIHLHADLIAGLPLEDIRSFGRSFDAVYGSCDMLQLGFLKLLKGSPLYHEAGRYGIVCAAEPPYEVLKTAVLSFEDLVRLHRVEEVLERFANSGHFSYTLEALMNKLSSPFDFFSSLAVFIGNIDAMSQLKAIERFRDFCHSIAVLEEKELVGRLRLDYYIHEAGSCPAFLTGGGELPVAPIRRSVCIQKAVPRDGGTAAEVHRFEFDPDGYYVIDRRRHTCLRLSEEQLPV